MENVKEFRQQCNNRLLSLLSDEQLTSFLPKLKMVELRYEDTLIKHRHPIAHVYFPCDCVCSILTELSTGQAVESGAVGNEGMTSVIAFLGGKIANDTMICQIPGTTVRMEIEDFSEAIRGETAFRHICQSYAQIYISTMAQSLACNRFHKMEQRLARWLLMSHDRVGREEFPITQDFMGLMLGSERPTVSHAAKILMDKGTIEYVRGKMKVLDRPGLESTACECYHFTREQFNSIMNMNIG